MKNKLEKLEKRILQLEEFRNEQCRINDELYGMEKRLDEQEKSLHGIWKELDNFCVSIGCISLEIGFCGSSSFFTSFGFSVFGSGAVVTKVVEGLSTPDQAEGVKGISFLVFKEGEVGMISIPAVFNVRILFFASSSASVGFPKIIFL